MNIAKLIEIVPAEETVSHEVHADDRVSSMNKREGDVVKIVEALRKVESSPEWSTLKEYVFDKVLDALVHRRNAEAAKAEPNVSEIHRLNGQIAWARRYADLSALADIFQSELTNLKKLTQSYGE